MQEHAFTNLFIELSFHACIDAFMCAMSGADLKKLFLESGGNFDLVEVKVKQWTESKKTNTDLESRVTKRQLKEKYFWDDARASN